MSNCNKQSMIGFSVLRPRQFASGWKIFEKWRFPVSFDCPGGIYFIWDLQDLCSCDSVPKIGMFWDFVILPKDMIEAWITKKQCSDVMPGICRMTNIFVRWNFRYFVHFSPSISLLSGRKVTIDYSRTIATRGVHSLRLP